MKIFDNNWKLATRNLIKQKKATVINICSLALSFAFVISISIYVYHDFSYDRFHKNAEHIFKPEVEIAEAKVYIDMATHFSMDDIENIKENIAGIEDIAFVNYSRWDWDNGATIKYNGNEYSLENMAFSDRNFTKVFSFQTISGNIESALSMPNKLVLTKDISNKIFGEENPLGKKVYLNKKPIEVGAVIETPPSNSTIQFSALVSYHSAKYFFGEDISDWTYTPFIQTKPEVTKTQIEKAISQFYYNTLPEEEKARIQPVFKTNLVPLTDLYFHDVEYENHIKHGNKKLAVITLTIGILILILAIINFVNLSLASSIKWGKELGIQRIMGANKNTVNRQVFIKGLLISLFGFFLSFIVIKLLLPWFNTLINYPLEIDIFTSWYASIIMISLLILTILCTGILPSFFLKNTIAKSNTIKGTLYTNKGLVWKSLVTFQLFITISLFSAALVISKQISYGLKKDIGLNTKNIITIPVNHRYSEFIENIKNHHQTISLCQSSSFMDFICYRGRGLEQPDHEKYTIDFNLIHAKKGFLETLGVNLIEGRDFSNDSKADNGSYIVNKTLVDQYNITKPLESTLNGKPIIGVMEDFNTRSLHHQIEPIALCYSSSNAGFTTVHFNAKTGDDLSEYMIFLRKEWEKADIETPFEYEFLDDRLTSMYEKDIKLAKSIISFSLLAIIIACLGIFGLLTYITETKTKEIGIRKVNGARIMDILGLINKELVIWTCTAAILSIPVIWFIMQKWLENFAYQTNLSWWVFAISGIATLGITLLTVSFQSFNSAKRNPIEALRYE